MIITGAVSLPVAPIIRRLSANMGRRREWKNPRGLRWGWPPGECLCSYPKAVRGPDTLLALRTCINFCDLEVQDGNDRI